jgi:hypothetical protein
MNLVCNAQTVKNEADTSAGEPIYFLDENLITGNDLKTVDPKDLAAVEILKDSTAISRMGNAGRFGVIFITTKKHAREKYQAYFKSKSDEFARIVPTAEEENRVVYILNDKILKDGCEADLMFINDSNFLDLNIIDSQQLRKNYIIRDKKFGIVVHTVNQN